MSNDNTKAELLESLPAFYQWIDQNEVELQTAYGLFFQMEQAAMRQTNGDADAARAIISGWCDEDPRLEAAVDVITKMALAAELLEREGLVDEANTLNNRLTMPMLCATKSVGHA